MGRCGHVPGAPCLHPSWGVAASTGYAHSVAVPVLLLEITGPFTNMRWFLHTAGLKDTTLYLVNGVCMTISFFMLRVVFNWWLFITRFISQREAYLMQPIWIRYFYYFLFPTNLALQLLRFKKIIDGVLNLLGVGAATPRLRRRSEREGTPASFCFSDLFSRSCGASTPSYDLYSDLSTSMA